MSIVAVAVGLSAVVRAQGKSQEELRKPFVGTWRLVSIDGGHRRRSPRAARIRPDIIMYGRSDERQIMPDRRGPSGPARRRRIRRSKRCAATPRILGHLYDRRKGADRHDHREGMLDGGVVDYVRKFELTKMATGSR